MWYKYRFVFYKKKPGQFKETGIMGVRLYTKELQFIAALYASVQYRWPMDV